MHGDGENLGESVPRNIVMKGLSTTKRRPKRRCRGWFHSAIRRDASRRLLSSRTLQGLIIRRENISSIEGDVLYKHPAVAAAWVVASRRQMGRDAVRLRDTSPGASVTEDEIIAGSAQARPYNARATWFHRAPKTSTGTYRN